MTLLPLSPSQKALLERSTAAYQSQVDDRTRAYLESRGLLGAIDRLRFGAVTSPLPEDELMRGRLAIPFIGPRGNIYDIRFRCIEDHDCKELGHGKYMGSDRPTRMYNTRAISAPTSYLFITEGELDAATLEMCGWPAVGITGMNGWKAHYARMLAGFSDITLIADGDEAGQKLAAKVRQALSGVRVIVCEQGQDVNSMFGNHGKEGLAALLRKE